MKYNSLSELITKTLEAEGVDPATAASIAASNLAAATDELKTRSRARMNQISGPADVVSELEDWVRATLVP